MFYTFIKKPGKLAKDSVILGIGLGFRAFAQALVVITVAHVLGSERYGAYNAVLAVAGMWVSFCGIGGPIVLMRDVARDPKTFPLGWGCTLTTLAWSTLPVLFLFLVTAWWILPREIPMAIILPIGLGELIFWPQTNAATCAYRGYERMGRSARMMLAPVLGRFAAAMALFLVVFWKWPGNTLILWSWLFMGGSLIAAAYTHYRVWIDLGKPVRPRWAEVKQYIRCGLPFSFSGSAQKLYLDADKFMLARLTTLSITGIYSAAYRVVDLAFLPLQALFGAAIPRLFRAGVKGVRQSLLVGFRLTWPMLLYSIAAGVILSMGAPVIPHILGFEYNDIITVVRWFAWLPLMSLPRMFLQETLTASNAQKHGMAIMLAGTTINIALNFWWIPVWGWQGAAAATYGAEAFMTLGLLGMIYLQKRKEEKEEEENINK
ncbi:MAG: oligosaccharide flippase family protein [Promethearchaeota archaeon]